MAATVASSGCSGTGAAPQWLTGGPTSDIVPGLVPPADRIEAVRAMAQQAQRAGSAERQQLAAQLSAVYGEEESALAREEIVRALSFCKTPAAVETLRAALKDDSQAVRIAACQALGRIGGPEASQGLGEVLASDVDLDVRLAAAKALGRTGDPAAIAA
ncbi:MAG TPA: HEAT repeat domain-containing protein, partial [Planctomycetaceae bacterium]|nr:HEAT repeat domain-containing protein [Planctomycetaceae bacterium]